MSHIAAASDVFHAVSDPTRRAILDGLRSGSAPVSEIAARFRVSRPAISKHLSVLRRAQLVREHRSGRLRIYALAPDRLEDVAHWIESYRVFWQGNLLGLKRHLEGDPP
jgi:DNA-binding transcriptional ArsR family regulator